MLRTPSRASSLRSSIFGVVPRPNSIRMMGAKMIEAMTNRRVARRIGVRVDSTMRAATKESPQMTATAMAEKVPRRSSDSNNLATS